MGLIALAPRTSAPSDDLDKYESGDVAYYARSDKNNDLYARPHGGTERKVEQPDVRDFEDVSTPSDPGSNIARIWAEAEAGHTVLHYKNSSGIDFEFLRDHVHIVRNETGSALSEGDVVYVTGGNGNYPTVAKADASDTAKMPAEFMLAQDISNNGNGLAFRTGDIQGIDTSSFAEGDEVFVSTTTAGGLTATEPSGSDVRQSIGRVVKAAASGIIAIRVKFGLDPGTISHDAIDQSTVSAGDHRSDEQVEDIVGALIAAATGSNISVTYDDAGDSLTIDTSALNEEEVEDVVNGLLATDSNLTLTYDDAGNTLTVGLASSIAVGELSTDAPSGQFTWQGAHSLLSGGACIAADGEVFQGTNAAEDAISHALTNSLSQVWLGDSSYDPIDLTIDGLANLRVTGMGRNTVIDRDTDGVAVDFDGAGTPAVDGARLQLENFTADLTDTSTSATGFKIKELTEVWLVNLQVQGTTGSDYFVVEGADRIIGRGNFGEGGDRGLVVTDTATENSGGGVWSGGLLAVSQNGPVIRMEAPNLGAGNVYRWTVGPMLVNKPGAADLATSDGNDNDITIQGITGATHSETTGFSDLAIHAQDGIDLRQVTAEILELNPSSAYTISNDSADRTFDADSTSTAELADVLATLIKDLGLDS